MPPPRIALIGRTNVGKSTLFNRLTEKKGALVSPEPGTTRDRKEGECLWRGKIIRIIDTGGLDVNPAGEIERATIHQTRKAMEEADILLFVVDLKTGPLPQERALAMELRKQKKPLLVVGNKAENETQRMAAAGSAWRLGGLPAPFPVSAIRGTGVGDLLDQIYEALRKIRKSPAEISDVLATRVAVIGKPNVGKSSLLNALLKEERFITSSIAHTTREPNDTTIEVEGKSYIFVDTAGMRKMNKVRKKKGLEFLGVDRTMHALKQSDLALFVLDANEPLTSQDRTLAGLIAEAQVGLILVANKWDLIQEKQTDTINRYQDYISASLPFLSWAPMIFVSAKTQQRVPHLFSLIDQVQTARYTEIPEEELALFLRQSTHRHLPSRGKGPKQPKVLGLKQIGVAPPTFSLTIQAKRTDVLHPSYVRYLENRLHESFPFEGTPLVIRSRLPRLRAK